MRTTQAEFKAALFNPDLAVPASLTDGIAQPAGKRFNVYRNNVIMSLKDALSESFPAIEKLVGAQNFSSLASQYVRSNPPKDPCMMHYGTDFPAFLEGVEPLAHLGYLADVARLELARRQSYHAGDALPFDPAIFSKTPPEILAASQITFAPSLRVVRSSWPILDIWHFNMTEGAPQPKADAQDVLVTRPEFDPALHALPLGSAELIEALAKGTPLGPAIDTIERSHSDFDFPSFLGLLLQTGAISGLRAPT